jgi:predicted oxidoreductase (fatty acid repression mutant protein)
MPSLCDPFLDAVRARRSNYTIQKKSPAPDERIIHIVAESTKHCPSSLNTMPSRTTLLLGPQHDKFWSIVDQVNRDRFSPDDYSKSTGRVAGFAAGYGTVTFLNPFSTPSASSLLCWETFTRSDTRLPITRYYSSSMRTRAKN